MIKLMGVAFFFTFVVYAKEVKKTYSAQDFEQAVMKAVEQRVNKVQVSNLSAFSKDLLHRESQLNQRERLLQGREQQIVINAKDFAGRVKEFEQRQQKLLGCLDEMSKKKEQRVERLVAIIGGMKPAKAADILSIQQPDLAVQILGGLAPARTSKIFNLMGKEISASLQKRYLLMQQ